MVYALLILPLATLNRLIFINAEHYRVQIVRDDYFRNSMGIYFVMHSGMLIFSTAYVQKAGN